MPDEIPISRKSTDDAKKKQPKAVREAEKKVRRHIEKGKPGPSSGNVDPVPTGRPNE